MEENEAPEKIYLHKTLHLGLLAASEINVTGSDVEYTRTDTFIEKACEWLTDNLTNYYLNPVILNDVIHDFKQAMKGE